jgi:hypothetical protein
MIAEICHFLDPKPYGLLHLSSHNFYDTQILSTTRFLEKLIREKLKQTGPTSGFTD